MKSKAEREFTEMFPHANVRKGVTHPFEVYAGDYLCSEGITRAIAFQRALEYTREGYITPDPNETATEV
jgi:hypothetical protein